MRWTLFLLLGILLLLMALASLIWREGLQPLPLALGIVLLALGFQQRRRRPSS